MFPAQFLPVKWLACRARTHSTAPLGNKNGKPFLSPAEREAQTETALSSTMEKKVSFSRFSVFCRIGSLISPYGRQIGREIDMPWLMITFLDGKERERER